MLAVGGAIGAALAARVQMTAMPQLVAILHSFVGAAAVLVGFAITLDPAAFDPRPGRGRPEPAEGRRHGSADHRVETFIGIFVGAVTFTGSIVAFGKLQGVIRSKPLLLPGRHVLNLAAVIACVVLGVQFVIADGQPPLMPLLIETLLASLLGIHLVMAIGGADMPVVVSMLNSYSGWAAAAAGFMLSNDLLIITGALVGSSGAILSYIMCAAMNRSFAERDPRRLRRRRRRRSGGRRGPAGEVRSITAAETAQLLLQAKRVIIVPGYGMAVAQAQYPVFDVTKLLRERGTEVRFAIHRSPAGCPAT